MSELANLGRSVSRADQLSALLDYAFTELFWISEYPNRQPLMDDDEATELAKRARLACSHIEFRDPDRKAKA